MPATLSEKAALLKRQHILQAATSVFAEHGFRGATIRMVAQEAGVSDGTIYNSFENKQALLLATLDPEDRMSAPSSAAQMPETTEAFIRLIFSELWRGFTPDKLTMQKAIFSEVLVNDELRTLYFDRIIMPVLDLPRSTFSAFAQAGLIRPLDVALLLRMMAANILGFVTLRLLNDEKTIRDWDAIPDFLADMFIGGLVSPS